MRSFRAIAPVAVAVTVTQRTVELAQHDAPNLVGYLVELAEPAMMADRTGRGDAVHLDRC